MARTAAHNALSILRSDDEGALLQARNDAPQVACCRMFSGIVLSECSKSAPEPAWLSPDDPAGHRRDDAANAEPGIIRPRHRARTGETNFFII